MRIRRWVLASVLPLAFALPHGPAVAAAREPAGVMAPASETAFQLARWVRRSGDNDGLPFLVIDKTAAQVLAFDADGQVLGGATALLGSAHGDESVPGIGERELEDIRPEERTTPAGRFMAAFGRGEGGREEYWVDYATAISLHPVVTKNPREKRLQRLRSPAVEDNRITFGCINVDPEFFAETIRPTFKGTRSVVYILPEARPIAEVFPSFAVHAQPDTGAFADAVDAPPRPRAKAKRRALR